LLLLLVFLLSLFNHHSLHKIIKLVSFWSAWPKDWVYLKLREEILNEVYSHRGVAVDADSFQKQSFWIYEAKEMGFVQTFNGFHAYSRVMNYTVCPTRYRTRNFFNNFTTNEDIRFTTDTFLFISHTTNVLLFIFHYSIFIGLKWFWPCIVVNMWR
jgi:hypothetical protein